MLMEQNGASSHKSLYVCDNGHFICFGCTKKRINALDVNFNTCPFCRTGSFTVVNGDEKLFLSLVLAVVDEFSIGRVINYLTHTNKSHYFGFAEDCCAFIDNIYIILEARLNTNVEDTAVEV
jgi:hypothetical protein